MLGDRPHHVAFGEDPLHAAVRVDDDQGADMLGCEHVNNVAQRAVRLHGDDVTAFAGDDASDGHPGLPSSRCHNGSF